MNIVERLIGKKVEQSMETRGLFPKWKAQSDLFLTKVDQSLGSYDNGELRDTITLHSENFYDRYMQPVAQDFTINFSDPGEVQFLRNVRGIMEGLDSDIHKRGRIAPFMRWLTYTK